MTPEEFTVVAEQLIIVPAVESLVALAIQTVPPERVERLVLTAVRIMEAVAVRAARDAVESRARRHS